MTAPGRVGVIADSTLQGHLLSSAVKGQGYQVLVSTEPEALEDRWLAADALDLWVVGARAGGSHELCREGRGQHGRAGCVFGN